MANTTIYKNGTILITGLDADWDYTTEMAALKAAGRYPKKHMDLQGALIVQSIQFKPSGASDVFIVHDGGINDVVVFECKCNDTLDDRVKYYDKGKRMRPVIDISDCTLATAANAKLSIILADI